MSIYLIVYLSGSLTTLFFYTINSIKEMLIFSKLLDLSDKMEEFNKYKLTIDFEETSTQKIFEEIFQGYKNLQEKEIKQAKNIMMGIVLFAFFIGAIVKVSFWFLIIPFSFFKEMKGNKKNAE